MHTQPKMLPRTVKRETTLIQDVTILHPGSEAAYEASAQAIAGAIVQRGGARPDVFADTEVIPARNVPLPDQYRERPLILLGNLNTNRALLPLYARYYCATDALYPGDDSCDLRTIVNPYGTGANVILAGGSTPRGVERAAERLITYIENADDDLTLPFMLDVDLTPALARKIAEWPNALLGAPQPTLNRDLITAVGSYGMIYAWTGDRRYGEIAADNLRKFNTEMDDSYGDWHYFLERLVRALPWIVAGGFLDEDDILRTDQLLLGTALGTQDMWWRMRHAHPPLGHRHHGKGTYEFYLIARYLQQQANPNPAVRVLCERWVAECQTFLDALARAGIDDQDDETTLNNMATQFWYALSEERYHFFESGNARRAAERALALHDNMGAGAGQGGYGEAHTGAMYLQQEATTAVAAAAYYYQDGELKWILQNMPNLDIPVRGGFWAFSPIFMHKFDTGPELKPKRPETLSGIQVLPVTSHQFEINNHPPEHIEYQGHMVNAPETWLRAEGIDVNRLPREHGFDKLVMRSGFAPEDAYLLLQGYQGGYRWQGHMQAANCIVRFAQAGHIFLVQNTRHHSQYHKNGVFISDGYNNTLLPPIAECLAVDDFEKAGVSITRIAGYHHADWTRHIFWSKQDAGFFVVFDAIETTAEGPFSFTCTWRTPGYAALDGRTWQARQGAHRFTLRSSQTLPMTNEAAERDGAARPYILRQFQAGDYEAGDWVTFQNLFYVRPDTDPESFDIRRLSPGQALVTRGGEPLAWCAAAKNTHDPIKAPGLSAWATGAWITESEILLARMTSLTVENGANAVFETGGIPIGLHLDMTTGKLTAHIDAPGFSKAQFIIRWNGKTQMRAVLAGAPAVLDLPREECRQLSHEIACRLRALRPQDEQLLTPKYTPAGASVAWAFDHGARLSKRLRNLTVTADPKPTDGFPEQLTDTVLPELRESWQQWPPAPHYEIALDLPEEIELDKLCVVGDSQAEPFFGTFSPLPDDITAKLSSDGFAQDRRQFPVKDNDTPRLFRRYRGLEDRFEAKCAKLGQKAKQVRLTVPAPPEDRPLSLHQVELYSTEQVRPGVHYLLAADLDGDGQPQIVMVTEPNELIVLDAAGSVLWRTALDDPVTHLSCHDLDGDGRRQVCAGFLNGEIRIFEPDGALRQSIPLGPRFRDRRDAFFGWMYSIESLAVWYREPGGRAALAVGGYAVVVFLDLNGEIVGHSWVDGSWQTNLLAVPPDGTRPGDLWVRCGWNHGVFHYEGKAGIAPSDQVISFGGVDQPMFRALRKVIPFVNGETRLFEWVPGAAGRSDGIVVAAENGFGFLSFETRDWLWKIEGGTPVSAAVYADIDGERAVVVGGYGGFVAAFTLADGQPLRRVYAGAPVVALSLLDDDMLVVATRKGVLLLDASWALLGFYPASAAPRRMVGLDGDAVVVAREDGIVEQIVF